MVGVHHRIDPVKYPFLEESQQIVRKQIDSIEHFLSGFEGREALERAKERVIDALTHRGEFFQEDIPKLLPRIPPERELASYALARILVSCIGDRLLIERLCRYEAQRSVFLLQNEDGRSFPEIRNYIAEKLNIDLEKDDMPVVMYVELISQMRDGRWRLVNRDVRDGRVRLRPEETIDLLRERIRVVLHQKMPLRVPPALCDRIAPIADEIAASYQQQLLEQFGAVEEEAFPPCIGGLIHAITAGTNLPHMARFAITAFLHTIGMSTTEIAEIYARAPDFDPEKTMYQVEHISGRGGTEYTPPSCATMRTFGLCTNRDRLCERVNHPLSYYRIKKSDKKKQR